MHYLPCVSHGERWIEPIQLRSSGVPGSAFLDHDFEIFAVHSHRAIPGVVELADQPEQIAGQRLLCIRLERRERLKHRPVESLEYVKPVLGRSIREDEQAT